MVLLIFAHQLHHYYTIHGILLQDRDRKTKQERQHWSYYCLLFCQDNLYFLINTYSQLNILIFIHLMNFYILCFAFKVSFNYVPFFKINFPDPSTKTCIGNTFASNYCHFYAVEHNDASTYLYPDAQSEIHKETVLQRFGLSYIEPCVVSHKSLYRIPIHLSSSPLTARVNALPL